MFKNALIFRIADDAASQVDATKLEEALALNRFTECGPTEVASSGWVEPRGVAHGALVEVVGGQLIMKLRTQTRTVPGSAVKEELDKRLDAIEKETGLRPRGPKARELKEDIVRELLPRAFTKTGSTLVWLDPKAGFLVVEAGSLKKADNVITELTRAFEEVGQSLQVALVKTAVAPSTAMSHWLVTQESPAGFEVERECELKSPDTGATVRYVKHDLDLEEVVEHIRQGKAATKLAMTWEGRVAFVLGAGMELKKVELLDVVTKAKESAQADEEFDADVALVTGELSRLIPDLIDALGGEKADTDTGTGANAETSIKTDGAGTTAEAANATQELEAA